MCASYSVQFHLICATELHERLNLWETIGARCIWGPQLTIQFEFTQCNFLLPLTLVVGKQLCWPARGRKATAVGEASEAVSSAAGDGTRSCNRQEFTKSFDDSNTRDLWSISLKFGLKITPCKADIVIKGEVKRAITDDRTCCFQWETYAQYLSLL